MSIETKPSTPVHAPKKVHGKHALHRLEVERAANGFSVQHHFRPIETRNGDPGSYKDPVTHVFPDAASMQAHVGQAFGGAAGNPQEPVEELPPPAGE